MTDRLLHVVHWFTVTVVITNGAWLLPQVHVGMGPDSLSPILFLIAAMLSGWYLLSAIRGSRRAQSALILIAVSAVLLHYGWQRLFYDPSLVYKYVAAWAAMVAPLVAMANCIAVACAGMLFFHESGRSVLSKGNCQRPPEAEL